MKSYFVDTSQRRKTGYSSFTIHALRRICEKFRHCRNNVMFGSVSIEHSEILAAYEYRFTFAGSCTFGNAKSKSKFAGRLSRSSR